MKTPRSFSGARALPNCAPSRRHDPDHRAHRAGRNDPRGHRDDALGGYRDHHGRQHRAAASFGQCGRPGTPGRRQLAHRESWADLGQRQPPARNGLEGLLSGVAASDPDWYDPLNWNEAGQLNNGNPDAGGNVVFFLIHRMCAIPNCDTSATCGGKPNTCASTLSTSALALQGSDQTRPTDSHSTAPAIHYRVTSKAVGPRNSISIVQSLVRAFN